MTGPSPMQIDSWQAAEANAATWMRHWGYADATVTPSGPDGGVDVEATGALAQVKWEASQTGAPALQRLVGARGRRDVELLFFSGAGFSAPAAVYAEEMDVALFKYALDGHMTPVSSAARALVRRDLTDRAPGPPSEPVRSEPTVSGQLLRNTTPTYRPSHEVATPTLLAKLTERPDRRTLPGQGRLRRNVWFVLGLWWLAAGVVGVVRALAAGADTGLAFEAVPIALLGVACLAWWRLRAPQRAAQKARREEALAALSTTRPT